MLLVVTAGWGALGCSSGRDRPTRTAVVYGDSLAFTARAAIRKQMRTDRSWRLVNRARPDEALCDWLPRLTSDIARYRPDVITVETIGDAVTPCMRDPSTGVLLRPGTLAYYAKFRGDLASFLSVARRSGAAVVIVSPPPTGGRAATLNVVVTQILAILRDEARKHPGTSVSDAARDSVSNHGAFTFTKRCLPTETAAIGCDPSTHRITVRTSDGLHFCHTAWNPDRSGPSCKAGAARFGRALAAATLDPPRPLAGTRPRAN
jgi:hypothetical protein